MEGVLDVVEIADGDAAGAAGMSALRDICENYVVEAIQFSHRRGWLLIRNISLTTVLASVMPIFTALGVVCFVFGSALGLVWTLRKIKGTLKADVKGLVRRFGVSLAAGGAGIAGTYLAIVCAEFAGLFSWCTSLFGKGEE